MKFTGHRRRLQDVCRFFALVISAAAFVCVPTVSVSLAQEADWHSEFDEICLKVQEGRALSMDELGSLIERCDKLIPVIETSDDPKKKVYMFRLKKCRSFFEYIIELKKSGKNDPVSMNE